MDFLDCVAFCAGQRGFVEQVDRLSGSRFGQMGRRAPLEAMIDEACGVDIAQASEFAALVFDLVWSRLPADAFTDDTRTLLRLPFAAPASSGDGHG
jgi:hypothetical protein